MKPDFNDPETFAIIGAAMEVHRQLGPGFLERVHQEALTIELAERGVPCRREVAIPIRYKSCLLECVYRADFLCYEEIIVELKASAAMTGADEGQLLNYLKATGHKRGLLFNFGVQSLQHKRRVFSSSLSAKSAESVDRSTP